MTAAVREVTPIAHGTPAGWNWCRVRAEGACGECKAAHAGYVTAYRQRVKLRAADVRHGTERGLIQHWAWDENPCELCQSWQRGYLRGLALEGQR